MISAVPLVLALHWQTTNLLSPEISTGRRLRQVMRPRAAALILRLLQDIAKRVQRRKPVPTFPLQRVIFSLNIRVIYTLFCTFSQIGTEVPHFMGREPMVVRETIMFFPLATVSRSPPDPAAHLEHPCHLSSCYCGLGVRVVQLELLLLQIAGRVTVAAIPWGAEERNKGQSMRATRRSSRQRNVEPRRITRILAWTTFLHFLRLRQKSIVKFFMLSVMEPQRLGACMLKLLPMVIMVVSERMKYRMDNAIRSQ